MRDTYHHGDLKAAIIAAADDLMREKGLEALTLRAAARRAGVSVGAPAHHFGSLKGILTEVTLLSYDRLGDRLEAARADRSGNAALHDLCLAYIRFALDYPGHFRLMFRADLVDRDDPRYGAASSRALMGLGQALLAYRGQDSSDEGSFETRAGLFADIAAVHGLAHLILEEKMASLFPMDAATQDSDRLILEIVRQRWPTGAV